jgi:hypothetical protein
MADLDDDELLAALGVELPQKKAAARTPREERIIAGFEDIVKFYETHGRAPQHGEERDIFERIYAVRLGRLRAQDDCRELLADLDTQGLLNEEAHKVQVDALDDDDLLAELGVTTTQDNDITRLVHVKPREEVKAAAEEIAERKPCANFDDYKPMFERVRRDLKDGVRQALPVTETTEVKMDTIREGAFFIIGGVIAYIAEAGDEIKTNYERRDSRLRVIYDNGMESSNILMRSLQRALHRDAGGRRISEPSYGPLFSDAAEPDDLESGTIYVLRSLSDHPAIAPHRKYLHKIGVTGGKVETRITNAALDPTYLLGEVEVVATYKLFHINRTRMENLFHRIFAPARLDLTIEDRFGNPVRPREWFMVPLSAINDAVERIRDGSITGFVYDPSTARLIRVNEIS